MGIHPRYAATGLSCVALAVYLFHPSRHVNGATGAIQKALPQTSGTYRGDGSFVLPRSYREWIFLSSGVDMVYGPKASSSGHSVFDNVFVDPASYQSFLANGTWPNKTTMVLEIRGAETNASINRGGHSQGAEINGLEVHLKDASRFSGGWAFFDVNSSGIGTLLPQTATCYTCHREHAAVDTTFAQFYPTLLPLARAKHTLSPEYLSEIGSSSTRHTLNGLPKTAP